MDARARSLLERLNTGTSPKPTKLASPETKSIVTASHPNEAPAKSDVPASSQIESPPHGAEAAERRESINDRLVSARQRSCEGSLAPSLDQPEDMLPVENGLSESITQPFVDADAVRETEHSVVVSDGDLGANPEIVAASLGSNDLSPLSDAQDNVSAPPVSSDPTPPQGCAITNEVPSMVTLLPMNPSIPRLQISTDETGQTVLGEGILQIANIHRSFSPYERDVIGASTNYIVYALKGIPGRA